ncbi:FAD-dependent monooxygenase [Arthrobacter sp. StoSoilB5]|jgi:2-polyprenyl-6-methoxyphenol hydroxylase-like FAD-dependent oxidoreductase|uniref:FAD-dependent monooxygenase n=1 Tax=Arthrobacter sp. StoSoilB5 TaxID=2830992 RepID=UPI001CC3CB41|nr:FAD-dependent monooxygenase [Arthrobacter sp. StoSoilB5]BCW45800.1 monooxygenase [Arthrobacter sp. StoSoilB5]
MKKVDIVGGGIAGLALAGTLDPSQFHVTVHEQRADLPAVGTTLAMWPEAQEALASLGILGAIRENSPLIKGGALRSSAGTPWISVEGQNLVGVARHTLLRFLDSAVPPTVQRRNGKVDAVPGDSYLAVAADGVHSMVRRSVWGQGCAAKLTPYLAVRGVIPEDPGSESIGEYWGRGDLFGIGPSSGGTNWYASFRSGMGPEGIDVGDALDLARRRYSKHATGIQHVLNTATPETSLAQRIWTTPPLWRYSRGNVVLIGDAAHAMAPNLGRGACESLIDAVTLGKLVNTMPLDQALTAYNRQRVLRTQQFRLGSSLMMRVALAESAQPLRDKLLELTARRKSKASPGSKTSQ